MTRLASVRPVRWLVLSGVSLTAAMAVVPAAAHEPGSKRSAYVHKNGDSFIFFNDGTGSTTMSGSMLDIREANRLRQGKEPLLYVRRGRQAYVIRDAALLRQGEEIFRPQRELGARQGALGSRQGALGKEQAALATRYPRGGWSPETARRHADISRQQSELGRQQSALGAEQARLGQQQAQLAREAQAKLRALVDDAIQRGIAQKVD